MQRPDRIVGDLSSAAHCLRDDFVAIDRLENRPAHFRPRQNRVAEVEHQRNVVGLNRRVGFELRGSLDELDRLAIHFERKVYITRHQTGPSRARGGVATYDDLFKPRKSAVVRRVPLGYEFRTLRNETIRSGPDGGLLGVDNRRVAQDAWEKPVWTTQAKQNRLFDGSFDALDSFKAFQFFFSLAQCLINSLTQYVGYDFRCHGRVVVKTHAWAQLDPQRQPVVVARR